jgi:voltage-gated potassium channel
MQLASVRKRLLKQRRFRQLLGGSILLALIFGFLIVPVEKSDPQSTIQTTSDGLWWSLQTLTTVGYGDVVPATDMGRIIGLFMQVLGAVMFGSLIALISTSMSRSQEEYYWNRLFDRLNHTEQELDDIKKHLTFLVTKDTQPKTSDSQAEQ